MSGGCFVEGCKNAPHGKCRVCSRKACDTHGAMRGAFFYCKLHKKNLPMGFAGDTSALFGDRLQRLIAARRALGASDLSGRAAPGLRQLDEFIALAETLDRIRPAQSESIASAIGDAANCLPAGDWRQAAQTAREALGSRRARRPSLDPLERAFEALGEIILSDAAERSADVDASNAALARAFQLTAAAHRLALALRLSALDGQIASDQRN